MSGHLDHGMYDEDSVEGYGRPHPNAERYFRAILSDPQIAALQAACAFFLHGSEWSVNPPTTEERHQLGAALSNLEHGSDWSVNPPTTEERHQLGAAWAVLSNAEVIVP